MASRPDSRPVTVPRPLLLASEYSWRLLLVSAAVIVAGLAFARLRVVVLAVVVAVMGATLLVPIVEWLTRRGWPRLAATWVAMLGPGLVVAGLFTLVGVLLARRSDELRTGVDDGVERLQDELRDLSGLGDGRAEQVRGQVEAWITSTGGGGLFGAATSLLGAVAGLLLAIVLTFLIMLDRDRMESWFMQRVAPARERVVARAADAGWKALAGLVRGTIVVGLFDAIALSIVLVILGVPLVIPVAIITFFGAFIPFLGAIVAGGIATLIALASEGPLAAVIVALATIAIQQFEGDVIYPLVVGHSTGVHPAVVLVAVTAGATLGGVAGAFVALPVVAVLRAIDAEFRALE